MNTKKKQFHNAKPDKQKPVPGAPKEAVRADFAKRLQLAMINKGWNQSDLARAAGIGRDNISSYIRAISLPGPVHLNAVAKALREDTEELLPSKAMPSVDQTIPALDVKDIGKGLAWLRVNQSIDWDKAIKIMAIINED